MLIQDRVQQAVVAAMSSPCHSKRGVVIWRPPICGTVSVGFNHQPAPFRCDGSESCKRNCGKTAIHAEQMAILMAERGNIPGAEMLHVKAKDGLPCASMAPSCLECSKLILFSGIQGMHLLHLPESQMLPGSLVVDTVRGWISDSRIGELQIRRYSAQRFHWLTAEYFHRIPLILPAEEAAC